MPKITNLILACILALFSLISEAVGSGIEQDRAFLQSTDTDVGESVNWGVISPGGTVAASVDFSLLGTAGQGIAGLSSSSKYILNSGFWSIIRADITTCCVIRVGDVNGQGEYPDEVTLGDIMLLVDVKFISSDCSKLPCVPEADVNQDGGVNPNCEDHVTLGDIMLLVDFLFISGPENATLLNCL